MKKINFLKRTIVLALSGLVLFGTACNKSKGAGNGDGNGGENPSAPNPHQMKDLRIVGEWKNVSVSDFSWQSDYGVNGGSQNGSYIDYKIKADGSCTCVKYVATSEPGSTYTVFQRTSCFVIAKPNGGSEGYYAFTYCPTSGIIELTKNGITTTKRNLAGNELYQENDPHSARDFFPAYDIVQPSGPNWTDPHHYMYYNYTDKNGNIVTTSNGNAKVTSMVDVLPQ